MLSFFFIFLFFVYNTAIANSNFVTIKLLRGLTLDLPKNWVVASNDDLLSAQYYDESRRVVGIVFMNYTPNITLSQKYAQQLTPQGVNELDAIFKEGISGSGTPILSWDGTKKVNINGLTVLISYYRRQSLMSSGAFRVRSVTVLASQQSFKLTVSYHESEESYLEAITDRIIKSIKLSGF